MLGARSRQAVCSSTSSTSISPSYFVGASDVLVVSGDGGMKR